MKSSLPLLGNTANNGHWQSKDRDNLHEEIDHHKNDQLQKQKDGKGHWKGELASQSEAAVSLQNP